jgi:hypothetical protein
VESWSPGHDGGLHHVTVTSLTKEGALSDRNDVPYVIRDAIEFVGLLGEKYPWVDALCIIQDQDENGLRELLGQMDHIYNQSVLTIVALNGDSANAPLPGLQPGPGPSGLQFESIQ